jgi:glutamate synthase (NADPH/NADH) large chain
MFLVDTAAGRVVGDEEIKRAVCGRQPYAKWVEDNKIDLSKIPDVASLYTLERDQRRRLQRAFGYSAEDLRVILAPMALAGEEPVGSMGTDTPLAVLSDRPVSLFRYFKQQFAQVTNPPIDPIREDLVMSLVSCVGGEGNLLDESPKQARLLELQHPILTNAELAKLRKNPFDDFRTVLLDAVFRVRPAASANAGKIDPWAPAEDEYDPGEALREALDDLCAKASKAIAEGHSILVVSDRNVDAEHAPIPSLLATAAVHHHLCNKGERARVGIVVESGEPREVADFALLIGYGAGAVNPYLAFDSLQELVGEGRLGELDTKAAFKNYVKAIGKGLLKVMSKMGISTLSSYHGAQIFEAVGIGESVIERYFTGTSSAIGGIGLREIAQEALARHEAGFFRDGDLDEGGVYAWRARGERHLWNPKTIASLQKAVRLSDAGAYEEYSRRINDQRTGPVTLRGLWDFAPRQPSVPIEEVEPAKEIVRRFATGAMSFGSISKEAHENLAIAMNRIGGKSNTGEGGEDEARYVRDDNGDSRRSAIKQVASGRFGVTAHYLVNADELQIKMAQGAKPGEGGQLPGHKVDAIIARVRHATPGVTLISPPPHHDIYSIEDLAQLIFDLKAVAPRARVSVKLVSESGVGTVAAGCVKAGADAVLVAGHDGGTGASPLSSIQHAGTPWELGLAEAHQVLVLNGLRARVVLQADGQMKTGRDVAIAALLGADEMGFATAPLVASGCIMMRKCHLNTCPVGIATQDPVLRARFKGTPEHVINYFFFVAEELRQIMARLGFRTLGEMIGRADCLTVRKDIAHPKARLLDFSRVLEVAQAEGGGVAPEPRGESELDRSVVELSRKAIERGERVWIATGIGNVDRAFGARLAGEIARAKGARGLDEDTIRIDATGTAGQSFGAFATRGMTLHLEGDANDYVGKGLSGGVLAIRPPREATFRACDNVIVGNTVLYGATSGRCFFAGRAGERFAVRNSGALAVVEGVGDHGCEYMTGGLVLVLGTTGRNFAAGMSGGFAFVLDEDGAFAKRVNMGMVTLEPLSEQGDVEEVRALLQEHVLRTGSVKGKELLERFGWTCGKMVKVVPLEYARVRSERPAPLRESDEQAQASHPRGGEKVSLG